MPPFAQRGDTPVAEYCPTNSFHPADVGLVQSRIVDYAEQVEKAVSLCLNYFGVEWSKNQRSKPLPLEIRQIRAEAPVRSPRAVSTPTDSSTQGRRNLGASPIWRNWQGGPQIPEFRTEVVC